MKADAIERASKRRSLPARATLQICAYIIYDRKMKVTVAQLRQDICIVHSSSVKLRLSITTLSLSGK